MQDDHLALFFWKITESPPQFLFPNEDGGVWGYANFRARFWVPLIALFSGMRMNEICQLDVSDIRCVDGVDCFVITSRSNGGGADKKVKTSTSERFVPIAD